MCIKIYIIWCKGKKNVYKIYDVGNWSENINKKCFYFDS